MNAVINHLINNRPLTTFYPIHKELELLPTKNYLFDLSYLTVLDVTGDKAREFLQGQLTCDLNQLSDIQMVQGAQCNLQGRILTLMDVINWQGIKMVMPKDLSEPTLKSLSKTAMLSRVSLKVRMDLKVFGFYLQNPEDIVPDKFFPETAHGLTYGIHYCCYHLGDGFYIFLMEPVFAEQVYKNFSDKRQLRGSLTWHTLRLYRQQIEIYPESRGLFLPHRLDLHQTPYISFNKGCYKGQEIIARMHYKAVLKHQLAIYSVKTAERIYSGQKIFKENTTQEIGEIIDYSLLNEGVYLVAVSILKGITPGPLFEEVCIISG